MACLALALIAAPPWARAQPPPSNAPPATPNPIDILTATVRSIDPEAGSFELITGVGYALRLVRLQVPATPPGSISTTKAAAAALRPGDVVRVRFAETATGRMATSIEKLSFPERK